MLAESVTLLALFASALSCKVSPQFWCDDVHIAKECQVLEQCQKFVWSNATATPVGLTLYYESLCPDCKEFFQGQLTPTFSKIASIMDLQLVPYGNARETQNGDKWIFECQHGAEECTGNLIETCAIALMKGDVAKAFPLISCMEGSDQMPMDSAQACGKKLGVDVARIVACTQSSVGNQLEHKMAVITDALNPPHKYVPWVTLNGVHTDQIQQQAQSNLLKLICDSYQGATPAGCASSGKEAGLKFQHSNDVDLL